MLNLRKTFQDYSNAASYADYIDVAHFLTDIDTGLWLTKSGNVAIGMAIHGIDYESLTEYQLNVVTKRIKNADEIFGSDFIVREYDFHEDNPVIESRYDNDATRERIEYLQSREDLSESRIYRVIELPVEGAVVQEADTIQALLKGNIRGAFSSYSLSEGRTLRMSEIKLRAAIGTLLNTSKTYQATLSDITYMHRLNTAEAYSLLSCLFKLDPFKRRAPLPRGGEAYPDYFLSDHEVRPERNHLEFDDYYVKVLTLKALPITNEDDPDETGLPAHALSNLQKVRGNYHIVQVWRAENTEDTKGHVDTIITHNEIASVNMVQAWFAKKDGQQAKRDEGKLALNDDLKKVKKAISKERFGKYTLAIVVYDKDLAKVDRIVREFIQAGQPLEITFNTETQGTNICFFGTAPGSHKYLDISMRTKRVTAMNRACFSSFFTTNTGHRWNSDLDDEYVAIFTTLEGKPYYFIPHVHGVGHLMVLGMTGAGKTFLISFLIEQAMKFNPMITIFDVNGSYRTLASKIGAVYMNITADDRKLRFYLFGLPNTPANLNLISDLIYVLMEQGNTPKLSPLERNTIYQKVAQVYELDPEARSLTSFANMLPPDMQLKERIDRWLRGGQYGYIFDDPSHEDHLKLSERQVFNFSGFRNAQDLLGPINYYIQARVGIQITNPRYLDRWKINLSEETWKTGKDDAFQNLYEEGCKTGRTNNASFWFVTQEAKDLEKIGLADTLIQSCQTKIFLADNETKPALYQEKFRLSPETAAAIGTLIPNQQLIVSQPGITVKNPDGSEITRSRSNTTLNLLVSKREVWLYGSSPIQKVRRMKALERFGNVRDALTYLVEHDKEPDEYERNQTLDFLDELEEQTV